MESGFEFRLFRIPVRVQPWFFLTAVLIGPHRGPIDELLIWVVVVFAGVLLHELGHAAACLAYGFEPRIELYAMGGFTTWAGERGISKLRSAAISAAGPAFGIAAGLASLGLQAALQPASGLMAVLIRDLVWVNLGWGLLNLAPVLPLDGGHIAAALAQLISPRNGLFVARLLSLALTAAVAVWALLTLRLWLLILGVVLTVFNYRALRHERAGPVNHQAG